MFAFASSALLHLFFTYLNSADFMIGSAKIFLAQGAGLGLPNVLKSQGQSLNLPSKLTVSLILEKRKNVLEKFWCS